MSLVTHFKRSLYAWFSHMSTRSDPSTRASAIRCAPMPQVQFPDRALLEEQARRLLERARGRTGASVDDMVRTIGALQPRGATTRRSWYDWQERPETISLLTGLAAIQVLGPEAAIEVLFGQAPTSDQASGNELGERVARVEQRIEVFAGLVAKLQEALEMQQDLIRQMSIPVDPSATPESTLREEVRP